VTSIFLLSDGLEENAQDGIAKSLFHSELFDDLDNSNFSIHTFGFGKDHDPNLMTDID
jgi:hypothetical protein